MPLIGRFGLYHFQCNAVGCEKETDIYNKSSLREAVRIYTEMGWAFTPTVKDKPATALCPEHNAKGSK